MPALFTLIALVFLGSGASANRPLCRDDLIPGQGLTQKFAELLTDQGGFYVQGQTYILKYPVHAPLSEHYRYLSEAAAARFLFTFDDQHRFVRDGVVQTGLFAFVLDDRRRLYVFRPGPRPQFTPESYFHTFPTAAGPLAAAGEFLFDREGRLVAVDPATGHYLIDVDLTLYQTRVELARQGVPLAKVRFEYSAFTYEFLRQHAAD